MKHVMSIILVRCTNMLVLGLYVKIPTKQNSVQISIVMLQVTVAAASLETEYQ